jgi:hypothetical protein
MILQETTQIWGKEFPGSMFHEAWELLFFQSIKEKSPNLQFFSALPI